jgi:molecular chaperone GrpE
VTAGDEQAAATPDAPAPGESPAAETTAGGSQETAAPRSGDTGYRRPGGEPEDHAPAHELDETAGEAPSAGEGSTGNGSDTAVLDEDLAATKSALAELTTDLQRLQAEYLNYKRRVERDRELVKENATYAVLSGLLPVLDDIDRAREHGEVEGGFKAVADSLERIVSAMGLTKYGAKGDEFDPNLHEALMHGHSPDVSTTTVDVVAHAGYRIGDRVVRAAKVTVLDPEG